MKTLLTLTILLSLIACNPIKEKTDNTDTAIKTEWEKQLDEIIPVFGHRNWIIVTDMAYPLQSKEGIITIYTNESQAETVKKVLKKINATSHVRANIYLDKEIDFVSEKHAPGIENYRKEITSILKDDAQKIMHEELIAKLDETAKTYKVLILKTNMTLPYTSVFIELECAYWSKEAENQLRKDLK